ncbi:MAG: tetratricopeptide repeat protein, partial [Ignavibacterium sp.]
FLNKSEKDFIDSLNNLISIITSKTNFSFFVDDYNLFDQFSREVLSNIIPLLQVNGIKVIIAESSDFNYVSDTINNLREVTIGSLTERQLSEYLQSGYYDLFPRDELKDMILQYADLLPGNIIDFIRDLIKLQIIIYDDKGVSITEDVSKLTGLEGSLSAIYNLRISNLNDVELNAAKVISSFDINVEQRFLATLLGIDRNELNEILSTLQFNNFILPVSTNPAPVITSVGLRKHIYSLIENKKEFHKNITDIISNLLPEFNRSEFAHQYELSEQYEEAYSVWLEEMHMSNELSAYSYIRSILEHLIKLPLGDIIINEVRYLLVETLYKLSDFNTTLDIIEQVDLEPLSQEIILELYIIKGSSLINVGKLEEGRDLIKSLIPRVKNESRKNNLLVEIAYVKFDMNKFEGATEICRELLNKSELSDENRGRIYNLLGMCIIYRDQSLRDALHAFNNALKCYEKSGAKSKVAAIEVNIGNVNNLLGNRKNAEIHWKKALDLNLSIGNIEQEGILLLNNGIYFFNKAEFEDCLEYYKRAYNIFLSLGNKKNQGIALSNLGEVYLTTCDYQKAIDSLEESREIFKSTKNLDELIPVLLHFGYFYFVIGSADKLVQLYNEVSALLNDSELKEKYRIELLFLTIINAAYNNEEIDLEELKDVRAAFFKREDLKNYVTVSTILVNYLIKLNLFAEALEELNHPQFVEVCGKNHIYNANREYMLGRISSFIDDDSALSQLDHFEKAYELLSDESIVELTWQVLFALAKCYGDRGNIYKAKNFIIYTRDIINLIAENIQTTQFKTAYLQKDERKAAMDKLVELERA